MRVEEFGDASAAKALNKSFSSDFQKAEYTSPPVTLLILLFAFGALVAAGVPPMLGLTAVLAALRSVVIPLTAIVLNLLSVGAAYGVLKLIFQDGYLRSLLGATSIGGVIDWLPLFLFVILFGLSMDYHVLILSRIREDHDRGMSTSDAIAHGIKSTAGLSPALQS